jgi:hypothetical protein
MGKQSGRCVKRSAKPRDLARVEAGRAARVTGGCQNNLAPAKAPSITDGTSNTVIFAAARS